MNNRAKFKQKHWIFGAVALVLLLVFIYPSAGKLVLSSTWGLLASVGIIPESGSQTLEVDALTVSNQLTVGGIVSFGGITYNWPTTQPQSNQVLTVNSINGDIVNLYWGTVDGTGGGGGGGGGGGTFTCGDNLLYFGQTYATVEIGSQCWMQENLNVGTCVTGTTEQASAGIATRAGCDGSDVNQVQIEKYCYDNNENNCYSDDGYDGNNYGGLYQWDEAMDYSDIAGAQGICPEGWHIPTDAEWHTLESGLAEPGESCDAGRTGWDCNPAGTKLKSTASDSFKALIAGHRHPDGPFGKIDEINFFWSSLMEFEGQAWGRTLFRGGSAGVSRSARGTPYGFPLRCVKDRTTGGGGEDGGGNDGGGNDGGGNDGGGEDGGGGTFACGDNLLYFGQTYATVEIGSQCWMQENLNVGTCVIGATEQASTGIARFAGCTKRNDVNQVQIEKYCYNDNEDNCYSDDGDDTNDYGGLYQWDEAMGYSNIAGAQGICPEGWHIPTDAEWHTLESGLVESGESCDAGRIGWDCNPAGTELKSTASDSFKGLLAGYRYTNGSFYLLGTNGGFWSSLESGSSAWHRFLNSSRATVFRNTYSKAYGFSLRCIKD